MNILELLKTVEELAKVIVQKNNELEVLKEGYDSKIRQLNEYIESVQQGLNIPDNTTTISGDQLLKTVEQGNVCPNCNNTLWNEQDYILLPKRKVKLLTVQGHEQQQFQLQTLSQDEVQSNIYSHPHALPAKDKKSKATSNKRICSYCKQLGHSRAKCPARLGVSTN